LPLAPSTPQPKYRPDQLVPGMVLSRSLLDPLRGHALLAAGVVLTPVIIDKVKRLGLVDETLGCIDVGLTAESREPSTPVAPTLRAKAEDLEASLYEGIDKFLDPIFGKDQPFREAWDLVKGLIPRVEGLAPVHHRNFRVQGGGVVVHPLNVMLLALQLGAAMRLSRPRLLSLAQASLLHDIGKRRLGKEHFKATEINPHERRLLERHVEHGMELLERYRDQFPPLSDEAREAIHAHHERWDGKGYPRGLKGEQIPLLGRIIAIADSYDAMLTDQVYRKRLLPEEAFEEILAKAGSAYDPTIAKVFERVIAPYPVNTLVRLDSGDVARVVALGADHRCPIVRLSSGAEVLELNRPGTPRIVHTVYPRRFPRFPRVSPVTLRVPDEHGAFPGCTLNMSMGGVCVALDAPIATGTQLTVELTMAGAPRLELPGLVVWSVRARRKTCLGLSFNAMPESARAWMETFCRA